MNETIAPHTHTHTHTHTLTLTPQMKGSSIFSVQQDTTLSSLTGTTWTTATKT